MSTTTTTTLESAVKLLRQCGGDATFLLEMRDPDLLGALLAHKHIQTDFFGTYCRIEELDENTHGLLFGACYHRWDEGIAVLLLYGSNPQHDRTESLKDLVLQLDGRSIGTGTEKEAEVCYRLALLKKARLDQPVRFNPRGGGGPASMTDAHITYTMTPLMYAAQQGYAYGVRLLLEEYHDDPFRVLHGLGHSRYTALDYALMSLDELGRDHLSSFAHAPGGGQQQQLEANQTQKKHAYLMRIVWMLREHDRQKLNV